NPTNDALDNDSIFYMTKIAPRIQDKWGSRGIDWDLSGRPGDANWKAELEGDQCLVFFLGGIQHTVDGSASCIGFTPDATDPANGKGQDERIRLYDFWDA